MILSFLVVDDIYVLHHNLKKHIKDLGHKVLCEAENGFDAIEMYKQYKPDVVTLDITMPAYNNIANGIDTLKK